MANDFQNPEHYSELGNSENQTSNWNEFLAEMSKRIRRNVIVTCVIPSHFPTEQHDSVFRCMLPFGFDSISERRELSSISLGDLFPPISSQLDYPSGFPLGASPGVGKSFFPKLHVRRRLLLDPTNEIIVGPEQPHKLEGEENQDGK